jgi:hypothetical protein
LVLDEVEYRVDDLFGGDWRSGESGVCSEVVLQKQYKSSTRESAGGPDGGYCTPSRAHLEVAGETGGQAGDDDRRRDGADPDTGRSQKVGKGCTDRK